LLSRAVDDGAVSFRLELDKRQKALSGPMARLRRLVQKVVLLVPVLVLLVKLGGQERIEAWLSQGGITGLVKILVGVLTSLFSVEGLVGLTVLGLCQVLLVWRMAMRRIRKTEREAERLAGGSINQLNQRMDDAVNRIGLQRQQSIEQVRRGLDRFRDLKSSILTADTAATNSPAG